MKQRHVYITVAVVVSTLLLPSSHSLFADGPIIRSGEDVSVEAQKVLEGDFYGFGSTVHLSGEAKHDAYIAGGTVTINGAVTEDLSIVGGVVQVHGKVADDVRIIGGEVTIAEPITGDLVIVANTVRILSTATIAGDVLLLANDVQIEAPVTGSVYGSVATLRINAAVGGAVSVTAHEKLILGDVANIEGAVTYKSENEIVRAQNAVVVGDISHEKFIDTRTQDILKGTVFQTLVLLFASLSLFLLLRNRIIELTLLALHTFGRQGLIGFGMLFSIPFIGTILLMSVLGIFFGVIVFAAYGLLLAVSAVASCIVIGTFVTKYVFKQEQPTILSVILGAVIMGFVPLIPVFGVVIVVLLLLITLGSVCTLTYRMLR